MTFFKSDLFKQIFRYGIFGGLAVGVDFVIFFVLANIFKMNIFVSNFISMNCGMVFSFFMNTFFNFKQKDDLVKKFFKFAGIAYTGIVLSMIIIYILHLFMSSNLIIKLISAIIVAAYQFVLNKLITYNEN